jgi:hypothetical protein
MRVPLYVLSAILPFGVLHAQCLAPLIRVSGTVFSASGSTVPNALVGVSWLQRGKPAGPALASTDARGNFSISFRFGLFSGSTAAGSDECKGTLGSVSVSARAGAATSSPAIVPVGNSKSLSGIALRLDQGPES